VFCNCIDNVLLVSYLSYCDSYNYIAVDQHRVVQQLNFIKERIEYGLTLQKFEDEDYEV